MEGRYLRSRRTAQEKLLAPCVKVVDQYALNNKVSQKQEIADTKISKDKELKLR